MAYPPLPGVLHLRARSPPNSNVSAYQLPPPALASSFLLPLELCPLLCTHFRQILSSLTHSLFIPSPTHTHPSRHYRFSTLQLAGAHARFRAGAWPARAGPVDLADPVGVRNGDLRRLRPAPPLRLQVNLAAEMTHRRTWAGPKPPEVTSPCDIFICSDSDICTCCTFAPHGTTPGVLTASCTRGISYCVQAWATHAHSQRLGSWPQFLAPV